MERGLVRFLNWLTLRLQQLSWRRRQRVNALGWTIGTRVDPRAGGVPEFVALSPSDLQKHVYLLGGSGFGKSKALELLLRQHIQHNLGFALIDPHSDLTRAMMAYLLEESRRAEKAGKPLHLQRVYLVEPFSEDVTGLNVLNTTGGSLHFHILQLLSIFKRLWSSGWGPRMEQVCRNLLLALALAELTLAEGSAFLTDARFRAWVLSRVSDEAVSHYWQERYDQLSEAARAVMAEPVLNKLDALLADPRVRCMLGQQKNGLDFRRLMDSGAWVFVNLSKGQLPHAADLLGSFIVAMFQAAAMSRADVPEGKRRPFTLLVDEFQSFQNDGFETILSEARKYQTRLVLAHQHTDQIGTTLQSAIFSCAANHLLFALSPGDQALISRELSGDPSITKGLVHLPVGQAVLHRRSQPAVRIQVMPVFTPPVDEHELDSFTAEIRRRHGRPLSEVEVEIRQRRAASGTPSHARITAPKPYHQEQQSPTGDPTQAPSLSAVPGPTRPFEEADDE